MPSFSLGQVVATPGALETLGASGEQPLTFLRRHAGGDWGSLTADDKALNEAALSDGSRIMSAYDTRTGKRIWIITDAVAESGRREVTTILLPDEY